MVVLAGMLLAATASVARADTTTGTRIVTLPVNRTLFNHCTGEAVLLSGELRSVFHFTLGDNGYRAHLAMTQHLTGVGTLSGNRYLQVSVQQTSIVFNDRQFGEVHTVPLVVTLVSQGGGDNLLLVGLLHYTFNANGELTAEVDTLSAECVG